MQFHNILIIRTDRIGDLVLTTPAIKALRQSYPRSRISILVSSVNADLVQGNPYLDEVLVDERLGQHKNLFGFFKLVYQIRSKKFDLAIIFHTKRRYNLLSFLAGIPNRLGYKNNKFGFLLSMPLKDTRPQGTKHEAEYCLDVLRVIGVNGKDLGLYVPLQKDAQDWANQWVEQNNLKQHDFIVIHPGSSDLAKCWPRGNFAELIDRLIERYTLKIVMIGSLQTISLSEEILRQSRHPSQIFNLTGKTSLARMVGLLRNARVLVSNDSGPVHVAAGLGINVISLFLRDQPGINAERWKPLGAKSHVLSSSSLSGQVQVINVDQVFELIEQILQKDGQYEIF